MSNIMLEHGLDDDVSKWILVKHPKHGLYEIYYEPNDTVIEVLDGRGLHQKIINYLLEHGVRTKEGEV
jgi:hypothetical protein